MGHNGNPNSLKNLERGRWKPGQSGNPTGRAKGVVYRLLRKTYEASPARFGHPDAEAQSISGVSPHNLIRLAEGMCLHARLKVWAKMYQSLRASCENDWKRRGYREATSSAWMGHSANVSREHYVRPLDAEFDAVAKVA